MSINIVQLGKAIRQIRELRGFSQEELGAKSGLKGNSVALIERGERGVSLDSLNELAAALRIPAACLTMLGTSNIKGDSTSVGLVKSMQELILSTVVAQLQLTAIEDAKSSSEKQAKAITSASKRSKSRRQVKSKKSAQKDSKKTKKKNLQNA